MQDHLSGLQLPRPWPDTADTGTCRSAAWGGGKSKGYVRAARVTGERRGAKTVRSVS